jgi:hypothetical protein
LDLAPGPALSPRRARSSFAGQVARQLMPVAAASASWLHVPAHVIGGVNGSKPQTVREKNVRVTETASGRGVQVVITIQKMDKGGIYINCGGRTHARWAASAATCRRWTRRLTASPPWSASQ